jgi:hypothetical protein
MYAEIHYGVTVPVADVMSDIVAILTGETTVGNLSASAITGDSSINVSENVAGWTLFDDVDANNKVLRAPISDDGSKYKYIKLVVDGDDIYWDNYVTWNDGNSTGDIGHRENTAGVVLTSNSTYANYVFYQVTGTESMVMMSASANHFASHCMSDDMTKNTGIAFVSEHTRSSPWDTIANAYSPIAYTVSPIQDLNFEGSNDENRAWFVKPLFPESDVSDYDISVAGDHDECGMAVTSPIGGTFQGVITSGGSSFNDGISIPTTVLDENKLPDRVLIPIGCVNPQYGNLGGDISVKSGIYLTGPVGSSNDTIVAGGTTYRLWVAPISLPTGTPGLTGVKRFAVVDG